MPAENLDIVQKREKTLVQTLQDKRDALDPKQLRSLQKKLRRAQRKRRRLHAEDERRAKAAERKAAKSKSGEPTES